MSTGAETWRELQSRYARHAYLSAPVTFLRRVVFGRDPYWRQYFWSRWGYLPRPVRQAARDRRVLWIDVLSGGEVTQAVTFCRRLRAALPGWAIVLSTNNRYSFDFARTRLDVDAVFDTPWDCVAPVRRALRQLNPSLLVCIQNIDCPVLVREAAHAGVATVLVSAVMSKSVDRHPIFRRTLAAGGFRDFSAIGAWSADDARGFQQQGVEAGRVEVTGNMKFDAEFLHVSPEERRQLRAALGLGAAPVLLAANTHPGEEALVGAAYVKARAVVPALRLVVVPRYQFNVPAAVTALRTLGLDVRTRTALGDDPQPHDAVVVVDTFGELSRLYSVADAVFLGGTTYSRNEVGLGQNPIEALIQRKPLFFGPFMSLWREITERLRAAWPDVEVTTAEQLAAGVTAVLSEPDRAAAMAAATDAILAPHRDDVQRNVDLVVRAAAAARAA